MDLTTATTYHPLTSTVQTLLSVVCCGVVQRLRNRGLRIKRFYLQKSEFYRRAISMFTFNILESCNKILMNFGSYMLLQEFTIAEEYRAKYLV